MDVRWPLRCSENEELAAYLLKKRQEMESSTKGLSENLDLTISNAYRNICNSKDPIISLKDLSQIKGVGKWILRLMQGFFSTAISETTHSKPASPTKTKRYVPQKNSVAYSLLITLYRCMESGSSFMRKQELIDSAEASGLSRAPIRPDNGKGRCRRGSSAKDWYTGWSCMKTLIAKGLVAKSSCPAKYMLTQEGREAAHDCILRSGFVASTDYFVGKDVLCNSLDKQIPSDLDFGRGVSGDQELTSLSNDLISQKELNNLQTCLLSTNSIQDDLTDFSHVNEEELFVSGGIGTLVSCCSTGKKGSERKNMKVISDGAGQCSYQTESISTSFNPHACTSYDFRVCTSDVANAAEGNCSMLSMPPHGFGGRFEEIYDVILVLDDRENFGSRSKKVVDNIRSQFKIQVEVRRLPVGDGIWVARHRQLMEEYVLDFIVERKRVDDLCSSIRDNRYRDQKLRLQRCGIKKLIYLVEGDPNALEAADSVKTACFTTEILEGFDIQRSGSLTDTVRKYGFLTKAIGQYYNKFFPTVDARNTRLCCSFDEFNRKCRDLEKMTVGDVFTLQLMQVPQVTEEMVLAITESYPTLYSLAAAYSQHDGDVDAQKLMLKNQIKGLNVAASRNIFNLVWGIP